VLAPCPQGSYQDAQELITNTTRVQSSLNHSVIHTKQTHQHPSNGRSDKPQNKLNSAKHKNINYFTNSVFDYLIKPRPENMKNKPFMLQCLIS